MAEIPKDYYIQRINRVVEFIFNTNLQNNPERIAQLRKNFGVDDKQLDEQFAHALNTEGLKRKADYVKQDPIAARMEEELEIIGYDEVGIPYVDIEQVVAFLQELSEIEDD